MEDKENKTPSLLNVAHPSLSFEEEFKGLAAGLRNGSQLSGEASPFLVPVPPSLAAQSQQRSRFFPDFTDEDPDSVSPMPKHISSSTLSSDTRIMNHSDEAIDMFFNINPLSAPILKLTNIPWEISTYDVQIYLAKYNIDLDAIHIPIDRTTGKTRNEAFVEMATFADLIDAIATKHRQIIKSREIFLNRSSSDELFRAHFPKLRLDLNEFITSEEISSIATICRYYKIHFSRKCAERPFEHVISVMKLLPWNLLGPKMQQQCFELLQLSMEALTTHLCRPNSNLEQELFHRMHQAAIRFIPMTQIQRQYLDDLRLKVNNEGSSCQDAGDSPLGTFDSGGKESDSLLPSAFTIPPILDADRPLEGMKKDEILEKLKELEKLEEELKKQLAAISITSEAC